MSEQLLRCKICSEFCTPYDKFGIVLMEEHIKKCEPKHARIEREPINPQSYSLLQASLERLEKKSKQSK